MFPPDYSRQIEGHDNGSFWSEDRFDIISAISVVNGFEDPLQLPDQTLALPKDNEEHLHINPPPYDFDVTREAWRKKAIHLWTNLDIIHWISNVARESGILCTSIACEKFESLTGQRLMKLTEKDFENYDKNYGRILYKNLKKLIPVEEKYIYNNQPSVNENSHLQLVLEQLEAPKNADECFLVPPSGLPDYPSLHNGINQGKAPRIPDKRIQNPQKQKINKHSKPPYSRKPKKTGIGRLWEFLRDLLKDSEYCPRFITWENYEEGMFRFVRSDEVAKLWGKLKNNPEMNYEKLSRAMRYYYKSKVLLPVIGRRLVYQFGPNSTGWQK